MNKNVKNVFKIVERKVLPEFRQRYLDIMRELRMSTDLGNMIESVTVMEHKTFVVMETYEYSKNIETIDAAFKLNESSAKSLKFRDRFRKIIPEEDIKSRFFISNGKVYKVIERKVAPENLAEYENIMHELRVSSDLGDMFNSVEVAYHEKSTFVEVYMFYDKFNDIQKASKVNDENMVSPKFRKKFREIIDESAISSRFMMSV